jgi:hypothetical protein
MWFVFFQWHFRPLFDVGFAQFYYVVNQANKEGEENDQRNQGIDFYPLYRFYDVTSHFVPSGLARSSGGGTGLAARGLWCGLNVGAQALQVGNNGHHVGIPFGLESGLI